MSRAVGSLLLIGLLAACTTSVPTSSPAVTSNPLPVASPSPSSHATVTTAPTPTPSGQMAACGAGSISATIEKISTTEPGKDAWVLFGLDRASGPCRLSRLSAVTVRDATHRTVVKVSDGALWTSDLSVALALRLDFLSLCPHVQNLPLSVELNLGNDVVATTTLPQSFAVPCNDGSHRAFIDGIVEASGAAPSPGGTCTSSQFDVGTATSYYDFSTAFTRHVVIDQPLRNAGTKCVLDVPGSLGVASGSGSFQAVSAINTGNDICSGNACHYVTPSSYTVAAGQAFDIGLSASWWDSGTSDGGPPPCDQAISGVNRAQIPVATGSIEIAWGIALEQVCSAPASISFAIEPK